MPRVKICNLGAIEVREGEAKDGVEGAMRVRLTALVTEERGRLTIDIGARHAQFKITDSCTCIVRMVMENQKDRKRAVNLAPLVGLTARWRNRATVLTKLHAQKLRPSWGSIPHAVKTPMDRCAC